MRQMTILLAVTILFTFAVAQEKPKTEKHAREIAVLKAEIDSIKSLVPDLQKFYNEQFTVHLNRLQGRIDERMEKIGRLQADTVAVKK